MNAILPSFMKYNSALELVRIGRDHDGGYLVSMNDIENSNTLISLGINDDWSFEEHFNSVNSCPIYAYDASINKSFFFENIVSKLTRFNKPLEIFKAVKIYRSYNNFFKGNRQHIEMFVGVDFGDNQCSMQSVFDSTDSNEIFLKIDIEGSEYRILENLINNKERITGLAIEFHDCDFHLERIKHFIESFQIPLVHIHANNCAPIANDSLLPLVLELTFSSTAELRNGCELPHILDMPNNCSADEIILRHSND